MNHPYQSETTHHLDKLVQRANEAAVRAATPYERRAEAASAVEAEAEAYRADLDPDRMADLIAAQNRLRDIEGVVVVLENAGGPDEARRRALSTPEVFDTLAKGYSERLEALAKLTPTVRKKLGSRRADLSESGVLAWQIEQDMAVAALVRCGTEITNHVAEATAAQVYAAEYGKDRTPRTFEDLFSNLTKPLPQIPAE